MAAGNTYVVTEGQSDARDQTVSRARELPAGDVPLDNELRLARTPGSWSRCPLPEKHHGTRLLVLLRRPAVSAHSRVSTKRHRFRERAGRSAAGSTRSSADICSTGGRTLTTPLAFLLNGAGHAVKIYAEHSVGAQCQADLARMANRQLPSRLPATYVKPPRRDFFKFGAAFLWSGYPEQALPYLQKVLAADARQCPRAGACRGRFTCRQRRIHEAEQSFPGSRSGESGSMRRRGPAWAMCCDARSDKRRGACELPRKRWPQARSVLYAAQCRADGGQAGRSEASGGLVRAQALRINPKSPEAANGLGLALAKQDQADEARRLF